MYNNGLCNYAEYSYYNQNFNLNNSNTYALAFKKKLFLSYNQFLKTKLKKNFSDDAYVQFLSLGNNYQET